MRYVRVDNGIVVEVGEFDCDPNEVLFHAALVWVCSDNACLGDLYDGTSFKKRDVAPLDKLEQIIQLERSNPISHRMLRETILAISAQLGVDSPAIRKLKAVNDRIQGLLG